MCCQQAFLNAMVAFAVRPIAQVTVAQLLGEELDHPILGCTFRFADVVHPMPSLRSLVLMFLAAGFNA
jgi:hypothetical protein